MSTTRNGPRAGSRSPVAPRNDRRPSSSPDQQLGPHADDLLGGVEELVAVGGVAGGRRGGRPGRRSTPWLVERPRGSSRRHVERALDRLVGQPAGGVHALAQPGDACCAGRGCRAGRRRVAAPPGRGSSSCRSRWRRRCVTSETLRWRSRPVDPLVDPAPDRVVAAGEVPGVVGVQALDARCGCRRRRPTGRGPAWPGGSAGVALGGVAAWAAASRVGVDLGLGRGRRRPSLSSRPTRVRSGSPTSQ